MKLSQFKKKYYDYKLPSSFGGVSRLHKAIPKASLKQIKSFLQSQDVYTKHKFTKNKFLRRKVMTPEMNYIWQADLIDVQKLSRFNKGVKFLLCVIDTLSRYSYVRMLKNKTGIVVTNAFSTIINKSNKPKYLETDFGKEFFNKNFQKFLQNENILLYHNYSDFKACMVERFNQTLFSRLSKHFTYTNTKVYYNVLDDIVKSYNNTVHSAIGMSPSEVDKYNETDAWFNSNKELYKKKWNMKPLYAVNDVVRIKKKKNLFEKGYTSRFTNEKFVVDSIVPGYPIMYKIRDLNNELLNGMFYAQELSKVNHSIEEHESDSDSE